MGTLKPVISKMQRELGGSGKVVVGKPLAELHPTDGHVKVEKEVPKQRSMQHLVKVPRGKK